MIIADAKHVMIQSFILLLESCPSTADRRNTQTRPACDVEIDDIINIFHFLDTRNALSGIKFVAADLDALPKFGPEELNVAAVVDRQIRDWRQQ